MEEVASEELFPVDGTFSDPPSVALYKVINMIIKMFK